MRGGNRYDVRQGMMSYQYTKSTDAYSAFSEKANEASERESKMKNVPVPNLTGLYVSTETELDQFKDIIFTTI
jgi:hypothetical protein